MKAILIDPYNNSISEVDYSGDFNQIYNLIDCEIFTISTLNRNMDVVFVDDEGLLTLTPASRFFYYEGQHQPFAGKGLILGQDEDGGSVEPTLTAENVRQSVRFLSLDEVKEMANAGDFEQ